MTVAVLLSVAACLLVGLTLELASRWAQRRDERRRVDQ